ncbi:MAG: hypothetical protein ABSE40_23820 [Candidatus Sulfotelmatobacter sp.]|jgi:hypothetical protein
MGRAFRFAQRVVLCVERLPWLGLSLLAVLTLSSAFLGQTSQDSKARVSLPTDWSHHHLVFSKPATAEQLKRVQQDPRYRQQLLRRSQTTVPAAGLGVALTSELPDSKTPLASRSQKLKRDWSEDMGAGATVGAGQYPGFQVGSSGSCSDFVVFNTSLLGATGQASVIAYNNVYHGCGTTIPSVYWAYNTGGTISTSVTFSPDGSQLAFVQDQGGIATLVLLTWASSGGSAIAPTTPTSELIGSYRGCTAPCMTTITLNGSPTDTDSAPFYDFTPGSDTLYVGDNAGNLHQFTGVFGGTPAETIGPWPVSVGTKLSSPVYDPMTGNVFVTLSYTKGGNGGKLAAVCATTTCTGVSNGHIPVTIGTVTKSGPLGPDTTGVCTNGTSGAGTALSLDSPIVDPVAGMVYAFLGNDGNGNSAVIQFPTTVSSTEFSSQDCGTESTVGTGSTTGVPLFAGTFDNLYFTSSDTSPSGNLYVCGNTAGDATLYQVGITTNTMALSGTSGPALSTAGTTCSPVTEVYDGTTDWIFLSVESNSNQASPVNCPAIGGCLMNFSVTTGLPTGTAAKPLYASGGSSGIVADTPEGSEVYYSGLKDRDCGTSGKGGCAVQVSQSGLD